MPTRTHTKLRRLTARLDDGLIDECMVRSLFVLTRHLIEGEDSTTNFPNLHLFCNWVMHPEIDKSGGEFALELADRVLISALENQLDTKIITSLFISSISPNNLFAELSRLYFKENIYLHCLFNLEKQNRLFDVLIGDLLDKPVKRQPKRLKNALTKAEGEGREYAASALRVVDADQSTDAKYMFCFEFSNVDPDRGDLQICAPFVLNPRR